MFASPESTAAAVAYMGAEMQWLNDAAAFAPHGDEAFRARFAAIQRAVELDRFGFAAQVLLARDNCTPDKCAAFALLGDSSVLKANMKAQVFNQYVSRYAGSWRARTQAAAAPAVAAVAPLPSAAKPPPAPAVADSTDPPPSHHPLSSKYWLPSSDTIPPVSIMNAEPPAKIGPKSLAGAGHGDPDGGGPRRPRSLRTSRVKTRRRPAGIAALRCGHVHIRPDRQSRRDRLPHHPHRASGSGCARSRSIRRPTRGALHVRLADEAHRDRPGAGARELSARSTSIIAAAQATRRRVHPSRLRLPVRERRLRRGLRRRRHRLRRAAARRDPRHGPEGRAPRR